MKWKARCGVEGKTRNKEVEAFGQQELITEEKQELFSLENRAGSGSLQNHWFLHVIKTIQGKLSWSGILKKVERQSIVFLLG